MFQDNGDKVIRGSVIVKKLGRFNPDNPITSVTKEGLYETGEEGGIKEFIEEEIYASFRCKRCHKREAVENLGGVKEGGLKKEIVQGDERREPRVGITREKLYYCRRCWKIIRFKEMLVTPFIDFRGE